MNPVARLTEYLLLHCKPSDRHCVLAQASKRLSRPVGDVKYLILIHLKYQIQNIEFGKGGDFLVKV